MVPLLKRTLDKGLEINERVAASVFNGFDWVFNREELVKSGRTQLRARAPGRSDGRALLRPGRRKGDSTGRRQPDARCAQAASGAAGAGAAAGGDQRRLRSDAQQKPRPLHGGARLQDVPDRLGQAGKAPCPPGHEGLRRRDDGPGARRGAQAQRPAGGFADGLVHGRTVLPDARRAQERSAHRQHRHHRQPDRSAWRRRGGGDRPGAEHPGQAAAQSHRLPPAFAGSGHAAYARLDDHAHLQAHRPGRQLHHLLGSAHAPVGPRVRRVALHHIRLPQQHADLSGRRAAGHAGARGRGQ